MPLTLLSKVSLFLQQFSVGDVLTWIGGTVGAATAFFKRNSWIVAPLKRAAVYVISLCPSGQNAAKLDAVLKELKPNGGSSLRDSLNRVESNLRALAEEMAFLKKRSETRDERMDVASFLTNQKGECIQVSKSYLKLCGLSEDEVLGHGWENVVLPSERETVVKEWNAAIEQKRDFHLTFTLRCPGQPAFRVKSDAYIVKNSAGDTLGWLGFVEKDKPAHF